MNTIMPDFDVNRDAGHNQDTGANPDAGTNQDTGHNPDAGPTPDTGANLDAGIGMDSDQAFNLDFDTKLNMAHAMVKVLNNADLVDCFTSVSARSMRNEADKAAYMAMREELLRRMQNKEELK